MDQDFNKAADLRDQVIELKRRLAEILANAHKIPKELQPGSTETYQVSDLESADPIDPQQQPTGGDGVSLCFQALSRKNPLDSQITTDHYARFTDRSRKVMQLANQEAQRFSHEYIGTEHILLGLVKEGSGVAANVLKNLDIDLRKVRQEVEKIVQHGPGGEQVIMGRLPHTPRAKMVIGYSVEEARDLKHNYVGTEHLLLGLLREQEGVAAQVFINLGLKLEDVREEVLNLLGHNLPADSKAKVSVAESAPLTVHQIELIHERIRLLNEQKYACTAEDSIQAAKHQAEADALKLLLEIYFRSKGQE